MSDFNPTTPFCAIPDGAVTHKTLNEFELDQKIRDRLQMIARAITDRDRCEKSAVLSAWRLGGFLIEKNVV